MGGHSDNASVQTLVNEPLHQLDFSTNHTHAVGGATDGRRVATLLEQLGDGWTILDSVSVGRGASEIDHIVIGPSGVFTINANYSPGKKVWVDDLGMYVGGLRESYIYSSGSDARRVGELLSEASGISLKAVGLIVLVDSARPNLNALAGGAHSPELYVVADEQLLAVIDREPIFTADQVARIVDAAIRATTWVQPTLPSIDNAMIAREFEALQYSLSTQRRRKSTPLQLLSEFAIPLISIAVLVGVMSWIGR